MKGSRPLTRSQVKAVLGITDSIREKALLTLGFATGYRISELLSLTIADVSTNGVIHSYVTVKAGNTKTKEGRTVLLNSDAKKALFAAIGEFGNVSTHTMRKTFAKFIYDATGGKIELVQIALGHKAITSTVSYLSFNTGTIDTAIMTMEF